MCEKCRATYEYCQAVTGIEESIEYIQNLTPDTVGIPTKTFQIDEERIEKKARCERKYGAKSCDMLFQVNRYRFSITRLLNAIAINLELFTVFRMIFPFAG